MSAAILIGPKERAGCQVGRVESLGIDADTESSINQRNKMIRIAILYFADGDGCKTYKDATQAYTNRLNNGDYMYLSRRVASAALSPQIDDQTKRISDDPPLALILYDPNFWLDLAHLVALRLKYQNSLHIQFQGRHIPFSPTNEMHIPESPSQASSSLKYPLFH
ncbi:hypothetical protein B0J17DRAFT_626620 [Rhizoctonia solani]|nr:hypothetical protein B0J17DRAFT_626620 [Rhizoctonia solani]